MLTIATLDVQDGSFGGKSAGSNDDAGNADELGDVGGSQTTDGSMRIGRVEQELEWRHVDVALRRVDDSLGAVLEGGLE